MATKIHFTKRAIAAIEAIPGKRVTVYDDDNSARGLCCLVTPKSRTFYVVRKIAGRVEWVKLGDVLTVPIEEARRRAAEIALAVANGANPAEEKRTRRAEWTFSDLFTRWIDEARAKGKKSIGNDEANFRLHLGTIAKKKLSAITRQNVRSLHASIGEKSGRYQANRVLALIRAVFNFGINQLDLNIANPAAKIALFKEESRERRLHPDEMPRFFEALTTEPNDTMRDYFLLSLLTGGRRANVMAMTWDQISMTEALWTIPAAASKNGKSMPVPLSLPALGILKERASQYVTQGYVFPGHGKKTGHIVEPKGAWKRLLQRAGLEDLRLHDLRRSLASFQIDAGVSLAVVGKVLGHQSQQTTAIYARLGMDPQRQAVEVAGAAILTAGKVKAQGEIVPMKRLPINRKNAIS
ncbi:tyrosine-type recombinase/integrase [Acidithiobacillus sp. MC6.1]|nr:tyrosine-type recombinase/integrase [Acidithiobacillus sp. MC6.1]